MTVISILSIIDKLVGLENWSDWKFHVRIHLQHLGVIGVVVGTAKMQDSLMLLVRSECVAMFDAAEAAMNELEYTAQYKIAT